MISNERPIRVAHVIGKLNAAGVESVINNYYRNIDHSKYQFDFFVDADGDCPPNKELMDLGARYYVIPPYQHLFSHICVLIKLFKENNYLIVHSSMNTLAPISLFCAFMAGIPIRINHNHSTAGKGEKINIIKYMLRPFSKCFATHFAACSKYAGEWLFGKKFIQQGRVKIFNNAIDVRKYIFNDSVRKKIRHELGISNKFVIGHVGRFCYQKNQDFLIDVFKSLHEKEPNSVLLLVGTGALKEHIQKKVKKLGLDDCVLFLGVRHDVDKLYQAMDVFVLPSRYEGLPVVGIEAQSSDLPCLFSNRFTGETVINPKTKILDLADDISVWSDSIISFNNSKRNDSSKFISDSGFDIKKEAKNLERFYDSLLSVKRTYTGS